jgi:hypothetical protein
MASTPKSLIRGAFALAVAGALSLGATQAFADPAPATAGTCDNSWCVPFCYENGAAYGWCVGGVCDCFYH